MFGKEKGPRERSSLVWRGQIVGMHQSGESIFYNDDQLKVRTASYNCSKVD